MAVANKKTETPEMLLEKLQHPLKREIAELRKILLNANSKLTEHVKWNAPSYCYNGDDRITFNLHAQDHVKLIFHRGAKAKDAKDFVFTDSSGMLEWAAKDRAVAKFRTLEEVKEKKLALTLLVNQWLEATVD